MLEYCKTVIVKVSFDRSLMRKELAKSLKWLDRKDKIKIRRWCARRFQLQLEPITNNK